MEKDFIQSLEYIGFTARIKRLSDSLIYDARNVYKSLEMEIEPNWHLIFLLLKDQNKLTITEISKELGFSHPAIIKITKKMESKGYLKSSVDESDSRKNHLSLTNKSLNELKVLEEKWRVIQSVIEDITNQEFLNQLAKIENKLADKSLLNRFLEKN